MTRRPSVAALRWRWRPCEGGPTGATRRPPWTSVRVEATSQPNRSEQHVMEMGLMDQEPNQMGGQYAAAPVGAGGGMVLQVQGMDAAGTTGQLFSGCVALPSCRQQSCQQPSSRPTIKVRWPTLDSHAWTGSRLCAQATSKHRYRSSRGASRSRWTAALTCKFHLHTHTHARARACAHRRRERERETERQRERERERQRERQRERGGGACCCRHWFCTRGPIALSL